VVHGTRDTLVPVEEARLFVELLRERSAAPVLYAELPGAQHAFEVFPSRRTGHALAGIERFLVWALSRHRARAVEPNVDVASKSIVSVSVSVHDHDHDHVHVHVDDRGQELVRSHVPEAGR
jgi:acetyl esterase/lipase